MSLEPELGCEGLVAGSLTCILPTRRVRPPTGEEGARLHLSAGRVALAVVVDADVHAVPRACELEDHWECCGGLYLQFWHVDRRFHLLGLLMLSRHRYECSTLWLAFCSAASCLLVPTMRAKECVHHRIPRQVLRPQETIRHQLTAYAQLAQRPLELCGASSGDDAQELLHRREAGHEEQPGHDRGQHASEEKVARDVNRSSS